MKAFLLILASLVTCIAQASDEFLKIPEKAELFNYLKNHQDHHGDSFTDEQVALLTEFARDRMLRKLAICQDLLPQFPKSQGLDCERVVANSSDLDSKFTLFRDMKELRIPLMISAGLRELESADSKAYKAESLAALNLGVGGRLTNDRLPLTAESLAQNLAIIVNYVNSENELRAAWTQSTGNINPDKYFPGRKDLEVMMRYQNERDLLYIDAAKRGHSKDSEETIAQTASYAEKALARQLEICNTLKGAYSNTRTFNCKFVVAWGSDVSRYGMGTFRDFMKIFGSASDKAELSATLKKDSKFKSQLTERETVLKLGEGQKNPGYMRAGETLTTEQLQSAMGELIALKWMQEQLK